MRFTKRLALLAGWMLCDAVAAAQGPRPDVRMHHKKQLESCGACHTDMEKPRFKANMAQGCVDCHKQKGVRGKVLASAGATVEVATDTSTFPPAPGGKGPGMSVPLYYPDSRLGNKPNEMVLIPAGEFIMGSDNRLPDEGPRHTVTLPAYYIDKYEVTNLQYKAFIDATGRRSPGHFTNRTFPAGKADHPVVFVTWHDARAYCEWAGKRLPTDQEWEKGARGIDGRMFPWGREFDVNRSNSPQHWSVQKVRGDTTPVGAFEAGKSPYGLYDMSGNVWEWTSSWYMPYPGNKHPSENYGQQYKVLKGGSWWDCSFYKCGISAPVFNRSFFNPKVKNESFGFRCAKDAQ